jgi:hypothetical protein
MSCNVNNTVNCAKQQAPMAPHTEEVGRTQDVRTARTARAAHTAHAADAARKRAERSRCMTCKRAMKHVAPHRIIPHAVIQCANDRA